MKIVKRNAHQKGLIFTFDVDGDFVDILFLHHALARIKKWNLDEEIVGEALLFPEEVLIGHNNRYIAHRRYDEYIIRAIYEYEDNLPVLITVYFPKAARYFKGGGQYENKILK